MANKQNDDWAWGDKCAEAQPAEAAEAPPADEVAEGTLPRLCQPRQKDWRRDVAEAPPADEVESAWSGRSDWGAGGSASQIVRKRRSASGSQLPASDPSRDQVRKRRSASGSKLPASASPPPASGTGDASGSGWGASSDPGQDTRDDSGQTAAVWLDTPGSAAPGEDTRDDSGQTAQQDDPMSELKAMLTELAVGQKALVTQCASMQSQINKWSIKDADTHSVASSASQRSASGRGRSSAGGMRGSRSNASGHSSVTPPPPPLHCDWHGPTTQDHVAPLGEDLKSSDFPADARGEIWRWESHFGSVVGGNHTKWTGKIIKK